MKIGSKQAPGPPVRFLVGHLPEFRKDVLGLLLDSSRRYGDIVRFRLGPHPVHLLNHPDSIDYVLQRRPQNFDKATRSARYIRTVCGESLLTSNGAVWQKQRRSLQPYFQQQHITGFMTVMVDVALEMVERWRCSARVGTPLDVASEMMRLTYTIVAKALFSTNVQSETASIESAMRTILPHTFGRLQRLLNLPDWLPTAQNRRFRTALGSIDEIVYRLIAQQRAARSHGDGPRDLLGMLLQARDEETGQGLTDREIRDQTITFLLAGHETTSNALTWAFFLLGEYPSVQEEVRAEASSVLRTDRIEPNQLPELKRTRQVLREAMRLYPPIWIMERRVIAEDAIDGYRLPAGSSVVICPYTLHRHSAFWENPDQFLPSRFAERPPRAYIPFGAGPRYCIGSEFAMMEAQIITALVTRAFRLRLVPGQIIAPRPGITLRTRQGLRMTVTEC